MNLVIVVVVITPGNGIFKIKISGRLNKNVMIATLILII